jgi:hypothetical protein
LIGAIVLSILALIFVNMGRGALRGSADHASYGVETESLHKKFSLILVGVGMLAGAIAGWLWASLLLSR